MSTFKEYVEICKNALRLSPSDFCISPPNVDAEDLELEIDNSTRTFIVEFNKRVEVCPLFKGKEDNFTFCGHGISFSYFHNPILCIDTL